MVNDPYQVLGVSRDASKEEIKKAYRQKARQYHPDTHPNDPNATKKMNEINEAYDMINHPEKYVRQQSSSNYSNQGSYGYGNNSGYGSGYSNNSGSSYSSNGYGTGYDNNGYRNKNYDNQGYGNYSQGGQYGWYGNFDDFFSSYGGYTGNVNVNPSPEANDSQEIRAAINFINKGQYDTAIQVLSQITSGGRNARWYHICSLAFYGKKDMSHAADYIQKALQLDPNNSEYQQLYSYFVNASRSQSYAESGGTTGYTTTTGCSGPLFKRLLIPLIIVVVINLLIWGGSCYGCTGSACGNRYTSDYYNQYYNQDSGSSSSSNSSSSGSNSGSNSGSYNPYGNNSDSYYYSPW